MINNAYKIIFAINQFDSIFIFLQVEIIIDQKDDELKAIVK